MSHPTHATTEPAPADAVVVPAAASTPDYEAMRRQHEELNRMSVVLLQLTILNHEVEALSRKHFPAGVTLTLEPDPETDDAYFVVNVAAPDSVEKMVSSQNTWIEDLWSELKENARFYRLRMHPHEAG